MSKIKHLSCDIETFSSVNLQKCGLYKYAESPDFEILLFGYSVDGGPVQVVDLACGEKIPADILAAIEDDDVLKWSHNSAFERICLSRHLGYPLGDYLNPSSWRCSMTWAAYLGLPLSLSGVGEILGLEKKKLTEGKELVKFFCQPCVPTKANSGRTRNLPSDAPEKWELFKSYNLRDVEVEMQITQRLAKFPVPDSVWDEYHLSEEINDRGIGVDMPFVSACLSLDARSTDSLTEAMRELTALENPNSVAQVKGWLADNGLEIDTLGKKEVSAQLKTAPAELVPVLQLRQRLAKSSVKKYTAMENAVCTDSRVRGMFMFLGASRTGRFAGRLVQLQNLPQNHIPDLSEARALAALEEYDALDMLYEDIPDTLSQLIRTAFVPQHGKKFIVADFSAIEARVISWFAREKWKSDAFANGEDIYCATASQMFRVPVVKHGVNGELRQKGKIAELACGYGGSVGALKAIANNLDKENVPTRFEGSNWYNKTVINILKNEKYCGDVLFQKTYSPGALSRVKQNRGELPQYYVRDALPAIIDRKTWEITQMEYARRVKQSSGQPSPEYPFEGRIFCGVCGRTVVYCRFRARGGYIPWWRCSTKVTRLKRSDDMTHDDCRIPIDRPTQVFVQAWNLVVSKRLQYEPRLWRIAEKDNNELTRYHASVMLRLIDEIGKLDNFDYMLSLRTLDHMELQLDGKLTVVFLGGIRITI